MKTKNLFFLLFFVLLIMTSCQKDDASDAITNKKVLTDEHVDFLNAWEVNPDEAIIESLKDVEGVYRDYIVSHDIEIPLSEFDIWKSNKNSNNSSKQYTSRYTVGLLYRNITVVADPSLSRKKKRALASAINEYNALTTSIKMTLQYSGSGDIKVIPSNNVGSLLAKAGFPGSSGRPYPLIRIKPSADNLSDNLLTGILMHELGHCIGLRHQDFRTRSSCSSGYPESGYVAYIPGTPTSDREPSIMLTCIKIKGGKFFSDSDKRALNILY